MLGVAGQLMEKIDGSQVDAEVSRQASGVLERVQKLSKKGLLAPTVVIHTGTNGILTEVEVALSPAVDWVHAIALFPRYRAVLDCATAASTPATTPATTQTTTQGSQA